MKYTSIPKYIKKDHCKRCGIRLKTTYTQHPEYATTVNCGDCEVIIQKINILPPVVEAFF